MTAQERLRYITAAIDSASHAVGAINQMHLQESPQKAQEQRDECVTQLQSVLGALMTWRDWEKDKLA